ncbi:MAG: hypothetical protein ABSE40_09770 [Candidatus Sulfotelmatobacter sp.]|jgi:hypothetical protein
MPLRFLRRLLNFALASIVLSGLSIAQQEQPASAPAESHSNPLAVKDDPERQRAMDLFDSGKFVDAMPLFEQLSANHDQDTTIKERWAFSMMAYATTLSDPELRKKARARARAVAVQAQKLGDSGPMIQLLLQIPPDGSEPAFSNRKDVDGAMKAAEADCARQPRKSSRRLSSRPPAAAERLRGRRFHRRHLLQTEDLWQFRRVVCTRDSDRSQP